jgi:hypothetical protein
MRPNASHDPAIQTVEEPSDVGALIILAPTPQQRVEFRNQLLGLQRHLPLSSLPYLVHETTDRLRPRVRIERTVSDPATNLAFGQVKFPNPALDFVAQKLEAHPDVDDPRFARMQLHA